MPTMLPATPRTFGDIRHVFSSGLLAVLGESNVLNFKPVSQGIVVLVDGLGASNLRQRAGHAPFLAGLLSEQKAISCGFPSTTATSITSVATGLSPGEHGIVGYRIQDPTSKQAMNLLSGWNQSNEPKAWQSRETLSEKALSQGIAVNFIGAPEYENSGFTSITFPAAKYLGVNSIEAAFEAAKGVLASSEKSITYLYLPQLDQTAHSLGWNSVKWTTLLEQVDAGFRSLSGLTTKRQGLCLTADHGVVDVVESSKIFLDEFSSPPSGISLVGGDTRAAMIYLVEPAETVEFAQKLTAELENVAWVLTKQQLIDTNWYGSLASGIADRLADVTVLARTKVAFYHRKFSSTNSLKMIGHHGSITSEEIQVPLLRVGQFV